MVYILISLSLFILTVIGHIFVHRMLVKVGMVTFKSVGIFLVGFLVNCFIIFSLAKKIPLSSASIWLVPLPFTAVFLYGLMVLVFLALFTGPFLGDESPSSRIFLLIKKKGEMSGIEIEKSFSDEELVLKRLDDMMGSKWIERKNNKYRISPSGRMIIRFIYMYRKLLGWTLIG